MEDAPRYSRHETSGSRYDRNFAEQLQEVRIAQAGVQILFAFLLVLPFQQRFVLLTGPQRTLYLVTLVAAASSVVVFTAPVAMHRVLFREGVKDFMVRYTAVLIEIGLGLLSVAIVGSTVLVLSLLVSPLAAVLVGVVLALAVLALWVAVPWHRRRHTAPGPVP